MAVRILDLSDQIGQTNTFGLPPEALPLLEGFAFHILRNGQKIHPSQVTVLSPSSFQLNFTPKKDRDVIEVMYEDAMAALTINCGNISNHILPIKAKIIDQQTVHGQVIAVQGASACINTLQAIDAEAARAFEVQASAVTEQAVFATVKRC